jgi:hypothetical protein
VDNAQLIAFCDYMIGGRVVGGMADEPAETPHSPELRAFIMGGLGDDMPYAGFQIVTQQRRNTVYARQAKAFAALLREAADGIDPPAEAA